MNANNRTPEELKQELDKLDAEQHQDFTDAIYLGLSPERAKQMEERRERMKALSDEIYGLIAPDHAEKNLRSVRSNRQSFS